MLMARAESEAVEAMIVIATCSLRSSEIFPFTIPQGKRRERRTEWPWVHEPKRGTEFTTRCQGDDDMRFTSRNECRKS